jgi:uncharacterized damage-inducible protein DinB
MAVSPEIYSLLALLDEAFEKQAWHGPNLKGALRGLTEEQLAFRPASGVHNIWELAVHCAYWKYAVLRRLTGAARGSFPLKGSNFWARPAEGGSWKDDFALLVDMHKHLRAAVAAYPSKKLLEKPGGSKHTALRLIEGIAAHDLYHAGQVQILKRIQERGEAG